MAKTPEGIEKEKVKKYLKEIGAYQFWPVPSGYGHQGVDCYACINGVFYAIEVKAPKRNTLTARQEQTLNQVETSGGQSIWGTASEILYVLRSHIQCSHLRHAEARANLTSFA